MATEKAIVVDSLSKSFRLPHEQHSGLKQLLLGLSRGKINRGYEEQKVLKNISFSIDKGDFFGIVGRNGSGKSTLLKLLAGIYTPDKGHVQVNGSLTPFIELGVGFNFELTGRENVFLNGALLGFSKEEMLAMYDDIVDFAELGNFMDQKLKNYSSGMQVRLAFSIAIKAQSDILLLDEVLAVGDEDFQRKCNEYFQNIKNEGKTVIIVTHDMNAVRRYCNKAVLIEKGKIKTIGSPEEVADQYSLDNLIAGETSQKVYDDKQLSHEIKSLDIKLISSPILTGADSLKFQVEYELNEDIEVDLGFSILYRGQSILEDNTQELPPLGNKKGVKYKLNYELSLQRFESVELEVYVSIFKKDGFVMKGFQPRGITFVIKNKIPGGGLLAERGSWKV